MAHCVVDLLQISSLVGLYTRTAVARLPLRQLGFLVPFYRGPNLCLTTHY